MTADSTSGTRKPARKRATRKEKPMTLTTNSVLGTSSSSSAAAVADKDFLDVLGGILPGIASTVAGGFGIDPRIAGQTVSQVLSIFGIGGGKAFTPVVSADQARAQLKDVIAPHMDDQAFITGLQAWLRAAVEPVQAQKQGKAYTPSVDLSKDWFSDAISTIGNAVSNVNWGQVAQVGMQALPFILSLV